MNQQDEILKINRDLLELGLMTKELFEIQDDRLDLQNKTIVSLVWAIVFVWTLILLLIFK